MTESAFTARLLKRLREHPAFDVAAIIKHTNPYHKGVPDFSITFGNRTLWVEVKKESEQPTEIQQWHLRRMDGATLWFRQPGNLAMIWHRNKLSGWLELPELVRWFVRCDT